MKYIMNYEKWLAQIVKIKSKKAENHSKMSDNEEHTYKWVSKTQSRKKKL